jgi:GNAT superfamily N-acetyltransferase
VTISLEPVRSERDFENPVLRSRASKAPHLDTIQHLKVTADGVESALVLLDVHPGHESVILYEIFLLAGQRNHGVGTKILAAVEGYVLGLGRAYLEVWPRSVDRASRSDAQLVRWYRRHGYLSVEGGSQRLKKSLRPV